MLAAKNDKAGRPKELAISDGLGNLCYIRHRRNGTTSRVPQLKRNYWYNTERVKQQFHPVFLEKKVILEAFAKYLHAADPEMPANIVLARWLWERLSIPAETAADKVLHCEIALTSRVGSAGNNQLRLESGNGRSFVFKAVSDSGARLLSSLYQYAASYEQQKWSRWVHKVKASDFKEQDPRN